jgi:N-acetylmuramoyl-L-alanine amidase
MEGAFFIMSKKVICLDAGHGGKDSGAVNGTKYEKTANLSIAKKVGAKLKAKGYEVRYTRTKDVYFSLAERCRMSNNWDTDIFISIHLNAATNKDASGIETWRYTNVGTRTKELAENVQTELIAAVGAKNRGVKKSSTFYVLKHTKASAILIEAGFISNNAECKKLFDSNYQNKLANAIVKGIEKTLK